MDKCTSKIITGSFDRPCHLYHLFFAKGTACLVLTFVLPTHNAQTQVSDLPAQEFYTVLLRKTPFDPIYIHDFSGIVRYIGRLCFALGFYNYYLFYGYLLISFLEGERCCFNAIHDPHELCSCCILELVVIRNIHRFNNPERDI